ncbi:MAG: 3-oxoadipate enol-lactonase [Chitinivibrionales bacterium]|nr:3-oxoadipate enol-lactonase [Chitinivibrionales bacterium]
MPMIPRDGYQLSYEWSGDPAAPVLILSHSLGSNREMWDPQMTDFARHFRVLRYDHPGHGQSRGRPSPGTIADYGADVLALMDNQGVATAWFCGLSLGGMVGMWLGAQAGDRFSRIVLCNTTAKIEDPTLLRTRIADIRALGLERITASVIDKWFTPGFRRDNPAVVHTAQRMFLTTRTRGYADTAQVVCDLDLRANLADITTPVLVVYGAHDEATPPAWNEAIADSIPNAQRVRLDTAHLSNMEAPRRFGEAVLRFLR